MRVLGGAEKKRKEIRKEERKKKGDDILKETSLKGDEEVFAHERSR